MASTGTAPPAPSHSRRPGTASPRESSPHSLCKSPVRRKQQLNPPHLQPNQQIEKQRSYLHLERASLNLRDALGDDEGDAVTGTAGDLSKVPAKQLQAALQLLVATLDGQSLQTALVTRQETLRAGQKTQ